MKCPITEFLKRWWIFIKERFSPLEHLLLIVFFFLANFCIASLSVGNGVVFNKSAIVGFFVILMVFFHMRIFDEIKDYKTDLNVHPERPLARGIISLKEAKFTAFILIILELCLSYLIHLKIFFSAVLVTVYTMIMYKEFFIGSWLRPKMATYAIAHTVVSSWMSFYVFSCASFMVFWDAPVEHKVFAFSNWMIFNIFEFGRKTFGKEEEKTMVESYSKRLGAFRAAFNVVLMAAIGFAIAVWLGRNFDLGKVYFVFMSVLFILIFFVSVFYAKNNNLKWAKLFRTVCSIFILFYNVIIAVAVLLKRQL